MKKHFKDSHFKVRPQLTSLRVQLERQLSETYRIVKKQSWKLLVPVTTAFIILAGTGGWLVQTKIAQRNDAVREAADKVQQAQLRASELAKQGSIKTENNQSKDSTSPTTTPQSPKANNNSTSTAPKYATSSDPRSTAYSTTPPTPKPASFVIRVTHAGQVAAGTLISYNATKGEKTYYGGDLVLSPSTVTISKSAGRTASFSMSLPDGRLTQAANLPWDEQNQAAFVATPGSSMPAPSVSVLQIVELFSSTVANGTYTIHFKAGVTNPPTLDGWVYDGFMTLIVTD